MLSQYDEWLTACGHLQKIIIFTVQLAYRSSGEVSSNSTEKENYSVEINGDKYILRQNRVS
jgi:hypothetical protein